MQNQSKFLEIVNYFEKIAREHVLIAHTSHEKHFFRFEFDEVATGLNASIAYPALILESYTLDLSDQRSDNPVKQRGCAFMLLNHVPDPGDYEAIHQTWDKLEEIADDIFARMLTDKRQRKSPIRDFKLESVEGTLLSFAHGNHFGIRYTFEIESIFAADMNPLKWNIKE